MPKPVESCLFFADGNRDRLIQWCVMLNQVHGLIEPLASRGRPGSVWTADYHDRYIRHLKHFEAAIDYVRCNPVKAGLCSHPSDWPWSSATKRQGPGAASARELR